MEAINKNMTFQELLEKFPDAAQIIAAKGLHCLGCSGALFESIEQGSKMHGLNDKEIDNMVSEINKKMEKSRQENKKITAKGKTKE